VSAGSTRHGRLDIDLGVPGRLAWIIVSSDEYRLSPDKFSPQIVGYTVIQAVQLLGLLCCHGRDSAAVTEVFGLPVGRVDQAGRPSAQR
jgi:hypothetical protein